jgi:hypothetical protein
MTGLAILDLAILEEPVAEIAACMRAQWKIENESFNVLKNHDCYLKHNFEHGRYYLALVFTIFNLLAFAVHKV